MNIVLTVTLERESGKFATKEEVAEALVEMIYDVDGVGADGTSVYLVTEVTWE